MGAALADLVGCEQVELACVAVLALVLTFMDDLAVFRHGATFWALFAVLCALVLAPGPDAPELLLLFAAIVGRAAHTAYAREKSERSS